MDPNKHYEKGDRDYCQKCGKLLEVTRNFYKKRDGTFYTVCRSCVTMHVDNRDEDTFLWILKEGDYPYIKSVWNNIYMKQYKADPYKITGASVLGRYLAQMRLQKYKGKGWGDTEELNAGATEQEKEQKEFMEKLRAEVKEKYEKGEIDEAEYLAYKPVEPEPVEELPEMPAPPPDPTPVNPLTGDSALDISLSSLVETDLTEDDIKYLAVKWGTSYTPVEWVTLERLYTDFMKSYGPIDEAGRLDTMKKICKTSLKMDVALDTGDTGSYKQLASFYDSLMKSGKFTEAQIKKDQKEQEDSNCVGLLVLKAEELGGAMPQWEMNEPQDIIDTIIKDNQVYLRTLVMEDPSLSKLIESYIQDRQQRERAKEIEQMKYDGIAENTIEDYIDAGRFSAEDEEEAQLIQEEREAEEELSEMEKSRYSIVEQKKNLIKIKQRLSRKGMI